MNRFLFFTFLLPAGLFASCFSCKGFVEQPGFVSIFGHDIEPLKIISYKNNLKNEVEIVFSKNIKSIECSLFKENGSGKETFTCKTEIIKEEETAVFKIIPEEKFKTEIGENFFITGTVKDTSLNSMDFTLPFAGANTNPAELRISEIRPLYSSSPKSEFIEIIVLKAGNLSGIKLLNVGNKKTPDYVFPPAEVLKGEFIVYHWRSIEDGIKDETKPSIISGGTQACSGARDFWGNFKTLPKRPSNVIVIEFNGILQDAVLFCDPAAEEKWNSEKLENDAARVSEAGIWLPDASAGNAVRHKISSTSSIGRKNINTKKTGSAADWSLYTSKNVTMGRPNK